MTRADSGRFGDSIRSRKQVLRCVRDSNPVTIWPKWGQISENPAAKSPKWGFAAENKKTAGQAVGKVKMGGGVT